MGRSLVLSSILQYVITLRSRQHGPHFADDTFKRIFLNENVEISIKISLMIVPKGPINNIPALVQVMAWHQPGDKPLTEPMVVRLLKHICVTQPQWFKQEITTFSWLYFHINYGIFICVIQMGGTEESPQIWLMLHGFHRHITQLC